MYEELTGLHAVELDILVELDRICKKNNLRYYMAFGTLLGAVRHKGFIPWDDDIDICMPYNDYVELVEACKKDLSEEFFLQTEVTDPESKLSYFKLRKNNTTLIVDYLADRDINHGINIDIYPLYNVPDEEQRRRIQLINTAVYLLFQAGQVPANHGLFMKIICGFLLGIIRGNLRNALKNKCHRAMSKYEDTQTKRKSLLFGNMSYCLKTYDATIFEKTVLLDFEGKKFCAPVGYDAYLTSFYGEYMKLPPKSDQGVKLNHIIKIDIDHPYSYYKGVLYCIKS